MEIIVSLRAVFLWKGFYSRGSFIKLEESAYKIDFLVFLRFLSSDPRMNSK
jgi:hypothetical protein